MSIRRNTVANFVSQGWSALMSLAFIPFYIAYLGIEAYGLVGVFAILHTWLTVFDLGLTPTLGREMARFRGDAESPERIRTLLRSVEVVTWGIGIVIAAVVALSANWVATEWLRIEQLSAADVATALATIGVVIGLRLVEGIYRSSLLGLQVQVPVAAITVTSATLRGPGAVLVLAFLSPTVFAFFAWQAVVSIATTVTLGTLLYRALPRASGPIRFSTTALRNVRHFAAGTVAITVLGFLLSQSDKIILSSLLSLRLFGIYSVAVTLASGVRLLAQPIDQAVYPRLTQLLTQDDRPAVSGLYHAATQYTAVLMGGFGIFLLVFGSDVLRVWTQDTVLAEEASPILWLLVLGTILNGLVNMPYYLQLASGWTGLLVRTNVAMVALFVPLIYLLTLQFQMVGAAAAWVLVNAAYLVLMVQFMHRRLLAGELTEWYVRDLATPLFVGLTTCLALRAVMPTVMGSPAELAFLATALFATVGAAAIGASRVRALLTLQLRLALGRLT